MGNGRRIRWAEHENSRLAAEYQRTLAIWQQNEHLIEWYRQRARSAQPVSPIEGLKLRGDERVFWTAANASVVEVPDTTSLFAPAHEVYSPTRETGGYLPLGYTPSSVRDNGFVAVTDTRVVFVGARGNREWSFAQLEGVAHGAKVPMSLMRVTNRQRLSGLVFQGGQAPLFQFHLSLALAEYRQDRAGFVAHLAGLLAHHRGTPPVVPDPALAAQAPSAAKSLARFYFGWPGAPMWRKLTPALVTVVGMLCLWGAFVAPPEDTSADRRATAVGPAALATSAPAVTPSPSQEPSQELSQEPSQESPSPSQAAPPPTTTTTTTNPMRANLCGAPQNPWNYTFCGGSTITDPPSDFCAYFDCVDDFWDGAGYVMQCDDEMFSRSGSCSSHGGNKRALLT